MEYLWSDFCAHFRYFDECKCRKSSLGKRNHCIVLESLKKKLNCPTGLRPVLVWRDPGVSRISRLPEQPCWLYALFSTAALTNPQKVLSIWRLVELKMLDFSDRTAYGLFWQFFIASRSGIGGEFCFYVIQSADFEALKLWKGRSGCEKKQIIIFMPLKWHSFLTWLFAPVELFGCPFFRI